MSDTKWTPGPWKAKADETTKIVDPGGGTVATLGWLTKPHQGPRRSADEVMANCQLIKAAPELYSALKKAIQYIPDVPMSCEGQKCQEPWCEWCEGEDNARHAIEQAIDELMQCRAALAKARGE